LFSLLFSISVAATNGCGGGDPACTSSNLPSDCDVTTNLTLSPGTYNVNSGVDICADGVVFDCNGATLVGGGGGGTRGVRVQSHNSVTVKNCDFESYAMGINLDSSSSSTLTNNHFDTAIVSWGILTDASPSLTISDSTFLSSPGSNIFIDDSELSTIENNVMTKGIIVKSSSNTTVSNNTITDGGIFLDSSGIFGPPNNFNIISSNIVGGSNSNGISVNCPDCDNAQVIGNTVTSSGTTGIIVYTDGNVVDSNVVNGSGQYGFDISSGPNNITDNIASNNTLSGFRNVFGISNTFINNTASFNTIHGFEMTGGNTQFVSNFGHNNQMSGVYSSSVNSNFTSNTMRDNIEHGIFFSFGSNHIVNNVVGNNSMDGISFNCTNCDNNQVIGNTVTSSGTTGININSDGNIVDSNYVNGSGLHGFDFSGSGNTISNNNATFNIEHGFEMTGGNTQFVSNNALNNQKSGVFSSSADSNYTSNTVQDNIEYGIFFSSVGSSVIVDNVVRNNGMDGLHLASSSNNILLGNIVNGNQEGIFITGGSGNNVTANKAVNNSVGLNVDGVFSPIDINGNIFCANSGVDAIGSPSVIAINNACTSTVNWSNPGGCNFACSFKGQITTPNPYRFIAGGPTQPVGLQDVFVGAFVNGVLVSSNYTNTTGYYSLALPDESFYLSDPNSWITIVLHDSGTGGVPYINIQQGTPTFISEVSINTTPFVINSAFDLYQDINFSNNSQIKSTSTGNFSRIADFGAIYYHEWQALDFALTGLNLTLDYLLPVDVVAWHPAASTHYSGATSTIGINIPDSPVRSGNRPMNREWHEFGHHVMKDSLIAGDNLSPPNAALQNHMGYANINTQDSWSEGFGELYSLLLADYLNQSQPYIYTVSNGVAPPTLMNLENNFMMWDHRTTGWREELAVAGIIWDLYDSNSNYPGGVDDDNSSLTLQQVWSIINQNTGAGTGGNRIDVKDIYDAFISFSIANPGILTQTHINQSFIAHGAYHDQDNAGRYTHQPNEEVGRSAHDWNFARIPYDLNFDGMITLVSLGVAGVPCPNNATVNLGPIFDKDGDGDGDYGWWNTDAGPNAADVPAWGGINQIHVIDADGDSDFGACDFNGDGIADIFERTFLVMGDANRRDLSPPPTYVFLDSGNPNITEGTFVLNVKYDPPYEFYNYNITSIISLPEIVSIWVPPLPSVATITIESPGVITSNPLHVNSTFYYEVPMDFVEPFLNHTFEFTTAPVITSTPVTQVKVDTLYTYDVDAVSPQNDTLTYSLLDNPDGMTINNESGFISWLANVTLPQLGPVNGSSTSGLRLRALGVDNVKVPVSVEVMDTQNQSNNQSWKITVSKGPLVKQPPSFI
jgi:parallel beta-helix repeat protein